MSLLLFLVLLVVPVNKDDVSPFSGILIDTFSAKRILINLDSLEFLSREYIPVLLERERLKDSVISVLESQNKLFITHLEIKERLLKSYEVAIANEKKKSFRDKFFLVVLSVVSGVIGYFLGR